MGEMQLEVKGHNRALSDKLWEFCGEEYLVDFSISCHGQQKKVHKCVLVLLMPILKEALGSSGILICDKEKPAAEDGSSAGESTKKPQCLNLDSVAHHAEDMNYLIEFAYTGRTTVPKEHADCILNIADSLGIKSLKKSICRWHKKGKLSDKSESNEIIEESDPQLKNAEQNEENVVIDNPPIVAQEIILISNIPNDIEGCGNEEDKTTNSATEKETDQIGETQTETELIGEQLPMETDHIGEQPTDTEPIGEQLPMETDHIGEQPTETEQIVEQPKETDQIEEPQKRKSEVGIVVKKTRKRKSTKAPQNGGKRLKQYVCKLCNKEFQNETQYVSHRDANCGTEPPTCKYCGHKTRRKAFLKRHIMAVHHVDMDENPLEMNVKCPKCDFVCYAKHQLRAHDRTKHEYLGRHKCTECSFTAPSSTRLRKHERLTHKDIREFMCDECGKQYKTKEVLKRHVLVVHKGVKPYMCEICGTKYKHKVPFKLHMQCHNNDEEYKHACGVCGFRTKTALPLKVHMRKEHGLDFRKGKRPKQKQELPVETEAATATLEIETVAIEYIFDCI